MNAMNSPTGSRTILAAAEPPLHRFLLPTAIVLLAALVLPLPALAQTCIAPAEGVPPSWNPPHWWDNVPPQPVFFERLNDPRWSGAAKITYGNGMIEQAEFRALHDTTHLYLSWIAAVAPAGVPEQNTLFLGYQRAVGGDIVIVKINLKTLVAQEAADVPDLEINAFLRLPDGTQGVAAPLAAEVTATKRVWINKPTANSWAVQVKLPLSEVQVSGGSFKLWYEMLAGTPSTPVVKFTWPRSGAEVTTQAGFPFANVYPPPGSWLSFRTSSGPTDPQCATASVSLDRYQIGTNNGSQILWREVPPGLPPKPVNTFFARPQNNSGQTIPAGGILATFRIANWGALPDWEQGVPIDTLWAKVPNGEDVPNSDQIFNGALADASNDARFDWTLTNAQLAPFKNGDRRPHQCMLVELKSTMSPGLVFTNASVYRNMDFVSASEFSRAAEVSVVGLTPLSEEPRDVYLFVETLNMPARVVEKPEPDPLPEPRDHDVEFAANDRPAPRPEIGRETPPDELEQLIADGKVDREQLDEVMPTYRVHAYTDTGAFVNLDGVRRPVLTPMTGFGYYVSHEGELEGWQHDVDGNGLETLAPNWYRIPVPNNGKTTVTTVIEALEPRRWSLSLHVGQNDPRGDLGDGCDGDLSWGVDLEYRFDPTWAAELFYGHEDFDCGGGDGEIDHLSLNGKAYFLPGPWRPFVGAGVGHYDFSPGPSETGFNLFGGVQTNPLPQLGLEATARYHFVDASGISADFLTYHLGARFRF